MEIYVLVSFTRKNGTFGTALIAKDEIEGQIEDFFTLDTRDINIEGRVEIDDPTGMLGQVYYVED